MHRLQTIAAAALAGRLDQELAGADPGETPLLAFDADGTLWSGDIGVDIFEALVAADGVREEARAALEAEAARFGVVANGSPTQIARSLDRAVALDLYPEARGLAMVAWAFAGWDPLAVDAFARQVVSATGVEARVHPEVLPLLAWARRREVQIWVVSASPRAITVAAAGVVGVPPERVLAMTPAIEAGRIAPRLAGPATYADGKRDALRAARPRALVAGAFGDSSYDVSMLREARLPVAVHPKPSLLSMAPSIPGILLLE